MRLSIIRTSGMKQEEGPNLVLEADIGAGELDLDDILPQPEHRRSVGDVRGVGRSSASSEEGTELAAVVGDERPGVSTPGERTRVVVRGEDRNLDGVERA